MTLYLSYGAMSLRGYHRETNEDSVHASPAVLALADGVGGHRAGEIASSLTIREFAALDRGEGGDVLDDLRLAAERGNAAIAERVRTHPSDAGMATTLTAIRFGNDACGLLHVGDSRAYRLRDGVLTQITKDETFVQSLVDAGRLTAHEAQRHPQRSIVLRALDGKAIDPVLERLDVSVGDRFLICSDGVSDVLSPDEIAEGLLADDPQQSAHPLAIRAMRAGSHDNVSCVTGYVTDRYMGYRTSLELGAVAEAFA
jgi:PPM family protein phosphatase